VRFSDLPESAKLMFKDTFEKNAQAQIKQDNQCMLDNQKSMRMIKDSKTYEQEIDPLENQ